jgi:hypothetical protein
MDRKALESTARDYPYLQGLWVLPLGFLLVLTGISNLQRRPSGPVMLAIVGVGLVLSAVAMLLIARYYRDTYGAVTPTRGRNVRQAVALLAWVVVLFVGGSGFLFWSPASSVCVYAAAFAAATLVYYAILVGLKAHHVVIWGSILVAGLLPVWGFLGADRDAVAMFPLGVALIASGVLDQRLLARAFAASQRSNLENSNVGR